MAEERARIAKDIHDDIGASPPCIQLLGQFVEGLKVRVRVRERVRVSLKLWLSILLAFSKLMMRAAHSRLNEPGSADRLMFQDRALFETTRWNTVIEAADAEAPHATEAFNELCQVYWRPLYVYLRRYGLGAPDAEDLTQGFLAHLLANQALRTVTPRKGKFRSFLLASLKNFLANERDKAHAQKRGGGELQIALSDPSVERCYQLEPVDHFTPDRIYERHWAHTVLDQAKKRLREEYTLGSKGERFEYLVGFLPGEQPPVSQAVAASRLCISEGAFRVELHRFRQRFGELLRVEIAQTVISRQEINEELRYLIEIVSE